MVEEFNLKKERERWYDKWLQKRLTGRAIIELKNQDEELINILKKIQTEEFCERGQFNRSYHNSCIDKLIGRDSA